MHRKSPSESNHSSCANVPSLASMIHDLLLVPSGRTHYNSTNRSDPSRVQPGYLSSLAPYHYKPSKNRSSLTVDLLEKVCSYVEDSATFATLVLSGPVLKQLCERKSVCKAIFSRVWPKAMGELPILSESEVSRNKISLAKEEATSSVAIFISKHIVSPPSTHCESIVPTSSSLYSFLYTCDNCFDIIQHSLIQNSMSKFSLIPCGPGNLFIETGLQFTNIYVPNKADGSLEFQSQLYTWKSPQRVPIIIVCVSNSGQQFLALCSTRERNYYDEIVLMSYCAAQRTSQLDVDPESLNYDPRIASCIPLPFAQQFLNATFNHTDEFLLINSAVPQIWHMQSGHVTYLDKHSTSIHGCFWALDTTPEQQQLLIREEPVSGSTLILEHPIPGRALHNQYFAEILTWCTPTYLPLSSARPLKQSGWFYGQMRCDDSLLQSHPLQYHVLARVPSCYSHSNEQGRIMSLLPDFGHLRPIPRSKLELIYLFPITFGSKLFAFSPDGNLLAIKEDCDTSIVYLYHVGQIDLDLIAEQSCQELSVLYPKKIKLDSSVPQTMSHLYSNMLATDPRNRLAFLDNNTLLCTSPLADNGYALHMLHINKNSVLF